MVFSFLVLGVLFSVSPPRAERAKVHL